MKRLGRVWGSGRVAKGPARKNWLSHFATQIPREKMKTGNTSRSTPCGQRESAEKYKLDEDLATTGNGNSEGRRRLEGRHQMGGLRVARSHYYW